MKRTDNVAADTLVRMGAAQESVPADTFLEHLHKPFVKLEPELEEAAASADSGDAGDGYQAEI